MELIKEYMYPATLETLDKDGNRLKLNLNRFKINKIEDIATVKQKYRDMYEELIDDKTSQLQTTIYDNNQTQYKSPSSDIDEHVNKLVTKEIAVVLLDIINMRKVDEIDELTELLDEIEKYVELTFNRENIDELYLQLKGVS